VCCLHWRINIFNNRNRMCSHSSQVRPLVLPTYQCSRDSIRPSFGFVVGLCCCSRDCADFLNTVLLPPNVTFKAVFTPVCMCCELTLSSRHAIHVLRTAVAKVRGAGGLSPPAPIWAPCNSMSPLIEPIKVILYPNNAKLVGLEWVWGLLQPGFVRWAPCFTKPL